VGWQTEELEAHGSWRYCLEARQLSWVMDRGRHEDAVQAMVCFWDPQERGYPKAGATVKVEILGRVLGLGTDMVEMEVASYEVDSDEMGEEKRPGLKWDETEAVCEAVEVVERCGRYTQD
jgi:hypothetical protein